MHESGINQDNAQKMNRELVLKLLRKHTVCTRTELARLTGLKPATITNIISEFQRLDIVREIGPVSEGKGRNAIQLALNPSVYSVAGIRLARKYLIVGAFDVRGEELNDEWYSIDPWMTPEDVLEVMKTYLYKAINEWTDGNVKAIGCAVPGPFLRREGKVAMMTGFPAWHHIDIQAALEKEFGVPVFMEHDANAGALAYYWRHGTELRQTLVYMAVGQGVGAGIVRDGALYTGALGVAGEIGHMSIHYKGRYCECGSRGCLEAYCSSLAFIKEVQRKIREGNYSTLDAVCSFLKIAQAVRNGDRLAREEYRKACELLAVGIINVINILNPDIIVLDDEMAAVSQEILRDSLERVTKPAVLPEVWENLEIVMGDGTQESVLQGAALMAIDNILQNPPVK